MRISNAEELGGLPSILKVGFTKDLMEIDLVKKKEPNTSIATTVIPLYKHLLYGHHPHVVTRLLEPTDFIINLHM